MKKSTQFVSTKGKSSSVTFSQAIQNGLAPDGGLYVPENFPIFEFDDFLEMTQLSEFAEVILEPFFENDGLESQLSEICKKAFFFPIGLEQLKAETSLLELFHGPTAAFKDFGAQFLAECFSRLDQAHTRTVLVATSGDTGGAVASAFHKKKNIQVGVLFPKNGVSELQRKQLTCWGDNVVSLSVNGTFDDCQRLVKSAFADQKWAAEVGLTSANSINIGRLLPQVIYYAAASTWFFKESGETPGVVVPTGNLGNSLAAIWAKQMGFPIRHVAMSCNANRVIEDYYKSGTWSPRQSIPTLANAMDVGKPSNMERLVNLFPDLNELKKVSSVLSVSDEQIEKMLKQCQDEWGKLVCPHTATALYFRKQKISPHWIVVATAHPAKFDTVVQPLIETSLEYPPELKKIANAKEKCTEIEPDLAEVQKLVTQS